jgi:hypothetical protein
MDEAALGKNIKEIGFIGAHKGDSCRDLAAGGVTGPA